MEKRPIFILAGLLAASLVAAEGAYKWVDEDGVIHYSDKPRTGAEVVDLTGYTRDTGARLTSNLPTSAADAPEEPEQAFRYESLSVAAPGPEETLWNIGGTLNVSLAVSPGLQNGHQVRVHFDGQPRMVTGSSFTIEEVHRGVHNIQAEIIDETGKLMIRSKPNRFYVQQNSVIATPGAGPAGN